MRSNRHLLSLALIAIFLSPFVLFLFYVPKVENPFTAELFSVLGLSALQAVLSALLTLAIGFLAALGLAGVRNTTHRQLLDLTLLWPGFAPVLFVLVATLNLFMLFTRFPFGFWGVVILHVIMNSGLIAVIFARLLINQAGGVIEVATIEGAGRWQIIGVVARELVAEFRGLFIFLFVLYFTSFSVPLVVGAQSGRTLETLIYEKLVASHQIGVALALSFLQILLLLILFAWFLPPNIQSPEPTFRETRKIKFMPMLTLVVAFSIALILGATHGFFFGVKQIYANPILLARLFASTSGTVFESFFVSLFTLGFSFAVVFDRPESLAARFFRSFAAPSAAVVGLAFVLAFAPESWPDIALLLLISFGFSILTFSTLYRLRLASALTALRGQIETARVLGASRYLVFKAVTGPLLKKDFAFVAGLGAFWASGDFAFASMVAGRDVTLAIGAHTLLNGYRLEAATVVTLMSLIVGVIFYLAYDWYGSQNSPEVNLDH